MNKPNINLRVYRRDTNDMTLMYNCKQINDKFALNPIISIDKNEVKYTMINEKSSNAADGDIKVFIDYEENKLNSKDRYKVDFCFGKYNYSLIVEPKGVIPNLKDNMKYVSQNMIWDNVKQRWVKTQSMNDGFNRNNMLVHDANNNVILNEILQKSKQNNEVLNEILNEIKTKIMK